MAMTELPLEKAFKLIEPGPVLLVTTNDGTNNVMTITWHMVTDFTPRIALTTGPWNYSFHTMLRTQECVLAVPGFDLAEKVVGIGDCSGADVDKFEQFGLTPLPGRYVRSPLVAECLGCIECCVADYIHDQNILVLQGVYAWIDEARTERRTLHAVGDGTFVVDGETVDLSHLMADKIPPGV